ncbi:MAG: hypothetical protein M3R49_03620 [Chloroflexota bacterium]|nr:hypothetical protein [Chloroflexota bacterium]
MRLTLHAYEAAALLAAARWVAEGSQGSLPDDAVIQLRQVLASYDRALASADQDAPLSVQPPLSPDSDGAGSAAGDP